MVLQGWLEVVLDRRLMQDDKRGVGQPVKDNKRTVLQFALTVEPRSSGGSVPGTNNPTLLGHIISEHTSHPLSLFVVSSQTSSLSIPGRLAPLNQELPCDVHLVNLRWLAGTDARTALVLHRKGFVCGFDAPPLTCGRQTGQVDLNALFATPLRSFQEHTLSLMHKVAIMEPTTRVQLDPMELYAFKLQF